MNCYLVDNFGSPKLWNFDIKPTDGATIFAYLGKGGKYWYRTPAIITHSWFETADFFEEFPCLVHKLSVILTDLDYKPQWKMA